MRPQASSCASFVISSGLHREQVIRAAFSPDGTRILTASDRYNAKLWDAASGKLIASLADPEIASFMVRGVYSGRRSDPGGGTEMAGLWDAASGKLIASFAHGSDLRQTRFWRRAGRVASF